MEELIDFLKKKFLRKFFIIAFSFFHKYRKLLSELVRFIVKSTHTRIAGFLLIFFPPHFLLIFSPLHLLFFSFFFCFVVFSFSRLRFFANPMTAYVGIKYGHYTLIYLIYLPDYEQYNGQFYHVKWLIRARKDLDPTSLVQQGQNIYNAVQKYDRRRKKKTLRSQLDVLWDFCPHVHSKRDFCATKPSFK